MQNPPKTFCLILVLTIFPFAWSCAGAGRQEFSQIRAAEGLPSSFVYSQVRDEEGFYARQDDSLRELAMLPQVVITGILVRNVPLKADSLAWARKYLRLKYHQNYLTFEFVAPGHPHPTKNQYICFLEGLDHDWHYTGSRTFASYTGLPSGDYIFRVKGLDAHGRFEEADARLAITILPPPWKSWWAYVIYLLLLVSLFLAWRLYDLKRLRLKRELALEHLEAEKLKELDSIKSRFFTNISHEFRTPLTLILGQIERLRATIREGEAATDLDMMQRSARRLHNLINQLLNLSKLESGQMKLHVCEENITALVARYLQSFESLAKKRRIELAFHSAREVMPLFVDRDKVEIILFNLLSNAFKFTPDGGRIAVRVAGPAMAADVGPEMVSIAVSDSGCGIPQEKIPCIFDRFYQVGDTHDTGLEGTGIGLALVRELVGLHHGHITVDSKVGAGTSFVVFFPVGQDHFCGNELAVKPAPSPALSDLAPALSSPAGGDIGTAPALSDPGPVLPAFAGGDIGTATTLSDPGPALPATAGGTGSTAPAGLPGAGRASTTDARPLLLVVEDNDDLRTYIRECLQEDYCLQEARQGEEGLGAATASIPDLVISDVMMPHMDGHEFCRRLKADERTCHIPVILLTARAALEDKLEGLQTGADDFITKPFNAQELKVRIRNLISQRERLKKSYKSRYLMAGAGTANLFSHLVSSDDKFLMKATDFITRNLSDPALSIDRFSEHMAMSHSQLYRKLRALVDSTPSEMIRSLRLQRAAELLVRHTGNISEIAYEVGFNNPSYFSECFRKHFGYLPSEYGGGEGA